MLAIDPTTAGIFALLAVPVSLYVCWSDMARMKIPNIAVLVLGAGFLVLALFVLPLSAWPWRVLAMALVLLAGFLLSAGGLLGAGDAKFAAAGVGFIDPMDYGRFMMLLAVVTLAAFLAHRGAAKSGLRRLAPDWESWQRETEFPFGLGLGGGLIAYLLIGALS